MVVLCDLHVDVSQIVLNVLKTYTLLHVSYTQQVHQKHGRLHVISPDGKFEC